MQHKARFYHSDCRHREEFGYVLLFDDPRSRVTSLEYKLSLTVLLIPVRITENIVIFVCFHFRSPPHPSEPLIVSQRKQHLEAGQRDTGVEKRDWRAED
jgi:hypothetical protein